MPRPAKPRFHKTHRRWYACVGERSDDGRAKEVYAPGSVDTEAKAWEWFNTLAAGSEARPVTPDRISVAAVADLYLVWAESRVAEDRLSAGHYGGKTHHLGFLTAAFGPRPAAELTAKEMTEFLERLAAAYSVNYVSNIASTISAGFNWAVRERLLDRNPVLGFGTPVVPKSPERFAERAEAAAFLRCWRRVAEEAGPVGRRYHRLTILLQRVLMRTGARPGELCSLWWSDIKWDAGRTSAGHAYAKATIEPSRWKSGAKTGRARTIYLSPSLTRALRREFERPDRGARNVFVHGRGRGGIGAGDPWADGSRLAASVRPIRRRMIADQAEARRAHQAGEDLTGYEAALLRLELADDGPQRIVNYRWRHTAISSLLMVGVDVPTIAELTGTSQEMISRIYGHLLDSHLAKAAESLHSRKRAG